MRPPRNFPRGLSEEESAAWAKLAESVTPLGPRSPKPAATAPAPPPKSVSPVATARPSPPPMPKAAERSPAPPARPVRRNPPGNLDSHWDRRLKTGEIVPDLSLDLHDHGLDRAYSRLMGGMAQARGMGARTVLVVTGKPRGGDAADRGERRGAIRAKILDWLAASEHGEAIAAIRKAHRRHGGDGALYIVLRRGG
ncbi:DNA mismatch repair protein MutS [Alteriqipengyuania lutimaris]|uniref:DNA mismatch repair protein MutS n=1 Tax=Alteriqipengyuania lutimaris TaxID=1538146 RepID=A0A395LI72_9SPHN|nr:DNA mismatch repair protein MutS [Alteriqipengyuania lutimaris]